MDFLNKEREKNEKYIELIYKKLERDKKEFINEVRSGLGNKIITETKEKKEENKKTFWQKLKKIFK